MTDDISPDHVQVNVKISDLGSPRESFSILGILSHKAVFPERSRPYASSSEIADDYDVSSPEWRAGNAAFSQSPRPEQVLILRANTPVTMKYGVGARNVMAGTVYALDVVGEGFVDTTVTHTAAAPASAAEVNGSLLTQLNAIVSKNYTATVAVLDITTHTFTADPATEEIHIVGNGYLTGDGPFRGTTTTTLPAGLALATDYYWIAVDADNGKLATSLANAIAGTAVNITDAGTGVHTLTVQAGATSPGAELVVTGSAPGAWFSIAAQSLGRFVVERTHTVTGLASDLDDILDEDDSWYTIVPLFASKSYITQLSTWAEASGRTMVFDTNDSAVLTDTLVVGTSTDIGAAMLALAWTRTMGAYHHSPAEMLSAAWMGRVLPADPGSVNPKFKILAGVTGMKLSTTFKRNLTARRLNSYYPYGGASRTSGGLLFSTINKFFDVTRNADWLQNEIEVNIFDIIENDLGFDEEGIQAVGGGIHAAFDTAVAQGVSSQSLPNFVQLPNIADISPSDHSERLLQGIKAGIEFAGFVDRVIVDVNLTL